MELYQVLCLIGVPSISAGIIKMISNKVKKTASDTESLKLGIQALLRAQMISEYNKWLERGYAPIYARENFENCWQQYHSLGANGVMNDIHNKFLELPTQEQE